MSDIKSYKIEVPQGKLDRLRRKLDDYEWPAELEDAEWTYGSPIKDIKRFHDYWKNTFNWRAQEDKLNQLPNFETAVNVDGFGDTDIHFLHQQSEVKGAIPLLFVHGWPGSFLEVTKMLPLLKGDNGEPAFHVVAPSLPNYAFSQGVLKKGFGIAQYAETCHKLMLKLGYDQYITQGGDWGFLITRACAYLYPHHVKAHHINWAWAAKPKFDEQNPEPEYNQRELRHLQQAERWSPFGTGDGRGYIAIQSTRPATINFLIADSPVGFLAWIWDKMVDWSDNYPWTDDEVCLWASMYVLSRAGPGASSYTYYEALHSDVITVDTVQSYIDCPLGISDFPVEIANMPVSWRHTMGPIVYQKIHDKGGHFAGWENPQAIAQGLIEMMKKGGGAYGKVEGRDGY